VSDSIYIKQTQFVYSSALVYVQQTRLRVLEYRRSAEVHTRDRYDIPNARERDFAIFHQTAPITYAIWIARIYAA